MDDKYSAGVMFASLGRRGYLTELYPETEPVVRVGLPNRNLEEITSGSGDHMNSNVGEALSETSFITKPLEFLNILGRFTESSVEEALSKTTSAGLSFQTTGLLSRITGLLSRIIGWQLYNQPFKEDD